MCSLRLSAKRDMLWQSDRKTSQRSPWSLFFEALFCVLLALPSGIAVWSWFSGGDAAIVDWFQAGADLGALLTLSIFWVYKKN